MSAPRRGDLYEWRTADGDVVPFEITRVARDGSWADIVCQPSQGGSWRKRQPLPLPPGCVALVWGGTP